MSRLGTSALAAMALALLWGCNMSLFNAPISYAVTGVRLNKTSISLAVGGSSQLVATLIPSNASNKAVVWSSSNSAVAAVSGTGLVTWIGGGSATIKVATVDGGKEATCAVTAASAQVSIAVSSVSLNKASISLAAGGSSQLTATVYPVDATNKTVTWSSSNAAVATVSNDGLVSWVGGGAATITVTTVDGAKVETCAINADSAVAVSGVTLDKASISLAAGGSSQLIATVYPADATNKTVTWSSSNAAVAGSRAAAWSHGPAQAPLR